jgi:hypothetical protein
MAMIDFLGAAFLYADYSDFKLSEKKGEKPARPYMTVELAERQLPIVGQLAEKEAALNNELEKRVGLLKAYNEQLLEVEKRSKALPQLSLTITPPLFEGSEEQRQEGGDAS